MALQTHSAALNPLKTLNLAGGAIASATLRATLRATMLAAPYSMTGAAADAILNRVKHIDIRVSAGTIFMSDAGDVADANSMDYETGEKREIRNCKLLLNTATVFTNAASTLKFELYS